VAAGDLEHRDRDRRHAAATARSSTTLGERQSALAELIDYATSEARHAAQHGEGGARLDPEPVAAMSAPS
jgi:hypothetical protein